MPNVPEMTMVWSPGDDGDEQGQRRATPKEASTSRRRRWPEGRGRAPEEEVSPARPPASRLRFGVGLAARAPAGPGRRLAPCSAAARQQMDGRRRRTRQAVVTLQRARPRWWAGPRTTRPCAGVVGGVAAGRTHRRTQVRVSSSAGLTLEASTAPARHRREGRAAAARARREAALRPGPAAPRRRWPTTARRARASPRWRSRRAASGRRLSLAGPARGRRQGDRHGAR